MKYYHWRNVSKTEGLKQTLEAPIVLYSVFFSLDRDVQHNITRSVINNNQQGALLYMSAGEVNPIVTIDNNQFKNNCKKLYGNFTSCKSAIYMDIQNTQTVYFRVSLDFILPYVLNNLLILCVEQFSWTKPRRIIHQSRFERFCNVLARMDP